MNENEKCCCPIVFGGLSPEVSAKLARSMHMMISCDKSLLFKGMTIAEFSLMLCMELYRHNEHRDITVAEAAPRLNVSVPAISRLLKNLQSRGLIERRADPLDRRSVRIAATERGSELYQINKKICMETLDRVLSRFNDEELQKYAELHLKFTDAVLAELNRLKKERGSGADKG